MASATRDAFLKKLSEFKTLAIATAGADGAPDCATVFFAYDDSGLYFSTVASTLKATNLARNTRASAAMDDHKQTGVQIRGSVAALTGSDAAKAKAALLDRHPHIGAFLAKDHVLYFKLVPKDVFLINFAWGVDWRVPVAR